MLLSLRISLLLFFFRFSKFTYGCHNFFACSIVLLYASTWIPLSWSNDRACSQISCVSLITSSREFPERYWNCVEFKACISRIFPYVCVEFFNVENIDTYVSLFFQHVSDVYRTRMSCAQFETKTKIQIICLVCVGVFTRDLWWRHLVRFPILIRFPRIARRRGLRTRLNFQLGVCFFFLLEMLKMFTSSVITSLWHHGFSWYSPVTPLCVLVSCTSIFESSHELLFVRLYCSSYQAIRYATLLPHLGSLFLGRRLQLLLMFLSMVYFSFLRKFKQFSLVSIRWFTFSTFFHTSVVSHEQ